MDDRQKNDDELSQWFSTYGVITAERILGTYQIHIPQLDFSLAIKNSFSFYHQIIQVPLKNVLNGIVLQQASDYHTYVQKLFVDYLLSGETSKGEEEQGMQTRDSLEEERKDLAVLGEEFHTIQTEQNVLIAKSQKALIQIVKEWKKALESGIKSIGNTLKNNHFDIKPSVIRNAINHALIRCNISQCESKRFFVEKMNEILKISLGDELKDQLLNDLSGLLQLTAGLNDKLSSFLESANAMNEKAQSYRALFYETILRSIQLIKSLADYKMDPIQDAANREALHFDKTIGERILH